MVKDMFEGIFPVEDHMPEGPFRGTIVCLPGVNSGAYLMQGIVPVMGERWRILRLNPPGSGGMPLPIPLSTKGYAKLVLDVLGQKGVGEFVLLGHSLGGYAAQELARMAPGRVKRLILVSTSRGQPDTAMDIARMQRRIGMSFWELQQLIVKHEGQGHAPLFGPKFAEREPAVFETFLKLRKENLPTQAATLAHLSAGGMFSSVAWVKKLKMETLVLHGTEDNLVSVESGRKLAQALPHAQWLELYNVGHFPMLEYAGFWEKVRQFAEEGNTGMPVEEPESFWQKLWRKWHNHG